MRSAAMKKEPQIVVGSVANVIDFPGSSEVKRMAIAKAVEVACGNNAVDYEDFILRYSLTKSAFV